MKPSFTGLLALTLALCLSPHSAFAEAIDAPYRYENLAIDIHVNDDASTVQTREWRLKVLKERAVSWAKQTSISYSTSIERAEVLEAYTHKADGRRIDVPKDNFQLEVNSGQEKGAPVYSDRTTLSVVFPDVAVGDSIVLKYRVSETEPMFPKHFSTMGTYPRSITYDKVSVRISWPTQLWAQYESREMQEKSKSESNGRQQIEWTYSNPQALKDRSPRGAIHRIEKYPGFAFSTFRNYREIAAAYGARAHPKAAVTPRISKLAEEIVAGKKTPREQAKALYDWVARNISYAGNCVGVGAVVPHDIDFILDNKMGDCKDHSTLLQALLAAKGIASTQALVNAGSTYSLYKIPVVSTVNHVINYLPQFDLYLDSTSSDTPFGMLPYSAAYKPALLVEGFKDDARTPAIPYQANRQIMRTELDIRPDGSVAGKFNVDLKGSIAADMRAKFRDMPKDREADMIKEIFKARGQAGFGKLQKDDPSEVSDSYRFAANFELKDYLDTSGPGALAIAPPLPSSAPIASFMVGLAEDDDHQDEVACSGGSSVEEYTIRFAKQLKIASIPKNLEIKEDFLTYRAQYTLKGNMLTVKRELEDRTPTHVCPAAMMRTYKKFAQKVLPNLKAQIIYQ